MARSSTVLDPVPEQEKLFWLQIWPAQIFKKGEIKSDTYPVPYRYDTLRGVI